MTDSEVALRAEMVPAVGIVEMESAQYERMKGIATMFAQARIFKDVNQAPVAFAKMVIGRELGLGIPQSMMGIHLIPGGGIQMHYSTILQLVRENGYDYNVAEQTPERCTIRWYRGPSEDGNQIGETTFTMEMAVKAEYGKKTGMYDKIPETMLLARAVSSGVKAHVPAVFKGMPIYVPGEFTPDTDLTEGEGTGELQGIVLPPEVAAVVARAQDLGHAGWADVAAWEFRIDRGPEFYASAVAEATAELDAMEQKITEAEEVVEPDVPIDTEGLPEARPQPPQAEAQAEAAVAQAQAEAAVAERPEPEINVEALRRRLADLKKKRPSTEEHKKLRDEEMDWIEEQLARAAQEASEASEDQARLGDM